MLTLKSLLGEVQHTQTIAQNVTLNFLSSSAQKAEALVATERPSFKPRSQTWSPCRWTLCLGGHFSPCMGGFLRAISCLFPICYREASGGVFATWRSINSEELFVSFEVWLLPGTVASSPMGTWPHRKACVGLVSSFKHVRELFFTLHSTLVTGEEHWALNR